MSTLDRYDAAALGFRRRLEHLSEADFSRESPCEGWTAGQLVDHSIEAVAFVGNLVGETVDLDPEVGRLDRFDGATSALRVKVVDEALASTVTESPFGRLALKQLVSSIVVHDLLVHTWDLARATNGDERLDDALCAHTFASMSPLDEVLRSHGFGPKVAAPEGADNQTQLLCFLGRRP